MDAKTKFNNAILALCTFLFVQIICNEQSINKIFAAQMIKDGDKMSTEKVEYVAKELEEKLIHTASGI